MATRVNRQDLTLRNLRAMRKELDRLTQRLARLEHRFTQATQRGKKR